MEDWSVSPEGCPITWTCEFLDGPRNDMDLCSLANVSYFDEKWGDWYFDSTDEIEWPPGTYSFRITGTVADQSDFYDLDLTLVSSCRVALFTVTSTF